MNADFRREQLEAAAGQGAEAHRPAGAGPRIHALRDRHHHLGGPGAGAGAAAEGPPGRRRRRRRGRSTTRSPTASRMFAYPRYVIKGGEVVVEEGEIRKVGEGREFVVQPDVTTRRSRTSPRRCSSSTTRCRSTTTRWRWSASHGLQLRERVPASPVTTRQSTQSP